MAKPAWITVAPASGADNGTFKVSASAHTGRVARTGTVTVTNANGAKPSKTINVSQAAKAEFLSPTINEFVDVPATGGKVTITGKSNTDIFRFGIMAFGGAPTLKLTINSVVQELSLITGNANIGTYGCTVKNDVGAANEYAFSLEVTLPANTTARRTQTSIGLSYISSGETVVKGFDSKIYQAGAASTLAVNPASLSLVTAGTAQTVTVTSNGAWAVA